MSNVPELERLRADHGFRWSFWFWAGIGAVLPLLKAVTVVIWSLIDQGPNGLVQGLGWLLISIPLEIAPPAALFLSFGLFYRTKIYAIRTGRQQSIQKNSIVVAALIIGMISSLFYGIFPHTVVGILLGGIVVAVIPMVIALTGVQKERQRQLTAAS